MAPPQGKKQVKLNAVMFSMLIEDLLCGPCTAQDIAEHSGMHVLTVQRTLRAMYRRKVLHIASWERDAAGRMSIRVFALGSGRDAKKPIKPRSQMNREWRARKVMKPLTMVAGVMV